MDPQQRDSMRYMSGHRRELGAERGVGVRRIPDPKYVHRRLYNTELLSKFVLCMKKRVCLTLPCTENQLIILAAKVTGPGEVNRDFRHVSMSGCKTSAQHNLKDRGDEEDLPQCKASHRSIVILAILDELNSP